ncbi:MAG: Na/Pi symporter [Candidatus Krumholzibacteriia bacterium]
MSPHGAIILAGMILGGLALFLFGIQILTSDLSGAAGARLRWLLMRVAGNRMLGLGLGTMAGFAMHSSGATVALVGFVDAGLLNLTAAAAPVVGANVGTTLSMQLVALRLEELALLLVALGFLARVTAPVGLLRYLGGALLGLGLIFVGLQFMKAGIEPYRDVVRPWLELMDGSTPLGLLRGVLVATAITAVVQSSGATIGMAIALASAGALATLEQAYPIVLGAHVGTCATALLGSIGRNVEARRTAALHLVFNLGNVVLAAAAMPLFLGLARALGGGLAHEIVNLHTAIMLVAAAIALPARPLLVAAARRVVPSRGVPPEPSHLDRSLLDRPEEALVAVIRELRRATRFCLESLDHAAHVMLFEDVRRRSRRVQRNEQVIDQIKISLRDYLLSLAMRRLTRRQAVLIQHLDRCMIDLERIGDHIDRIREISELRRRQPRGLVDRESLERLFELHHQARGVVALTMKSLDADAPEFAPLAAKILHAREEYVNASAAAREAFMGKVRERAFPALAGLLYSEYVASLDRIVRHARSIALAECQPRFRIKPHKLGCEAALDDAEPPPLVDARELLARFHEKESR